jgi:hypothetical protein
LAGQQEEKMKKQSVILPRRGPARLAV